VLQSAEKRWSQRCGEQGEASWPDGSVRIRFKQPSRTGATFTQVSRDTFLARLCALVPPPGFHMVRYYGVLAGRPALRDAVVPRPHPGVRDPEQLPLFVVRGDLELAATTPSASSRDPSPSRLSWARLLARVFAIDVELCRLCGGGMRVVRAVIDPDDIGVPPAVKMQVPGHWQVNESAVGRQLSPGAQDVLSCSRSAAGSLVDRSRHANSPGGSAVGLRSRVLLPRCSSHGHSASHAHAHAGGGSWMSVSPAVQHIS
jgi:hypothetical protein